MCKKSCALRFSCPCHQFDHLCGFYGNSELSGKRYGMQAEGKIKLSQKRTEVQSVYPFNWYSFLFLFFFFFFFCYCFCFHFQSGHSHFTSIQYPLHMTQRDHLKNRHERRISYTECNSSKSSKSASQPSNQPSSTQNKPLKKQTISWNNKSKKRTANGSIGLDFNILRIKNNSKRKI